MYQPRHRKEDHPPSTTLPQTPLSRRMRATITAVAVGAAVLGPMALANAAERDGTDGALRSAAAGQQAAAAFAEARGGLFESLSSDSPALFTSTTKAKPAPTTTTTAAPAPAPVVVTPVTAAPAPPPTTAPSSGYADPADPATWDRLAQCESGGNWAAATGNGYYGGLQFSLATWQSVGGTGYPHEHSREVQIEMGQRLQARSGWGQWPSCTRQLGYR